MMNDLHSVEFTEQEKQILGEIGVENEDYAICAIFDHRSSADVEYEEENKIISVSENGHTIRQTVDMVTDVCESEDPHERIGVGVSMLEVAINAEQQWIE